MAAAPKKPTPRPSVRAKTILPPKPQRTSKPKITPTPKFTPPTVAEFKQSAAYKAGDWTYKQYVDAFKAQYDAKYKRR